MMACIGTTLQAELAKLVGKRVARIVRILFELNGRFDQDDGPLELHFDDGRVLLLDGEGDGETLRLRSAAWADPFAEPLSAENRRFVAESGRWRRVDCTNAAPFTDIAGGTIESAQLLDNQFGVPAGVALHIVGRTLWFIVDCDESTVHWEPRPGFRLRPESSMSETQHPVAIVLDPAYGDRVAALATKMHVWMCESPANIDAARRFWEGESKDESDPLATGITTFRPIAGASPEEVCAAILNDVEEHHGEYAHEPPLSAVLVVGARALSPLKEALEQRGLSKFSEDESGVWCTRNSE